MRFPGAIRFQTCLTRMKTSAADVLLRGAAKLRDDTDCGQHQHDDVEAPSSSGDWTVDGRSVAGMATCCGRMPTS